MKIIGVENTIMDELFEDLPLWRKEEHKTLMWLMIGCTHHHRVPWGLETHWSWAPWSTGGSYGPHQPETVPQTPARVQDRPGGQPLAQHIRHQCSYISLCYQAGFNMDWDPAVVELETDVPMAFLGQGPVTVGWNGVLGYRTGLGGGPRVGRVGSLLPSGLWQWMTYM